MAPSRRLADLAVVVSVARSSPTRGLGLVGLGFATLVGLLGTGCRKDIPAGDPARPDIVVISIDSLRPDHLSGYGYGRDTSPHLDALAARGLRFTEAHAASPWTLPSHMTMLTGLWPIEHGVIEDGRRLAADVPTVAERMQAAGYATAGFVSTIYVSGTYGFSRGFDAWDDYGIAERDNLTHPVRIDTVTKSATDWARSLPAGKPAFLFLHTYDVHYPYLPPEPYNSRYDRAGTPESTKYRTYKYFLTHPLAPAVLAHQVAQYDESIRALDDGLGAFIAAWEAARPTTWIVTADHGDEFGERGSWGHAHTLKPEALRIPLIVAGPGIAPAVRDDRVGTIDIAATVAALAGEAWPGVGVDVRAPVPERPFFAETSRFSTNRLGLWSGSWRLDADLATGRPELYDLSTDPEERQDVAAEHPDEVARLTTTAYTALGEDWRLEEGSVRTDGALFRGGAWLGRQLGEPGPFGAWPPDSTMTHSSGATVEGSTGAMLPGKLEYVGAAGAGVELSAATRAQLEALGYVQE